MILIDSVLNRPIYSIYPLGIFVTIFVIVFIILFFKDYESSALRKGVVYGGAGVIILFWGLVWGWSYDQISDREILDAIIKDQTYKIIEGNIESVPNLGSTSFKVVFTNGYIFYSSSTRVSPFGCLEGDLRVYSLDGMEFILREGDNIRIHYLDELDEKLLRTPCVLELFIEGEINK